MTDYEGEIDKLLEKMHEKVGFSWIKNDGKTHTVASHATGDNCITEARQALLALLDRARADELDELYNVVTEVAIQRGASFEELAQAYDDRIAERLAALRKEL